MKGRHWRRLRQKTSWKSSGSLIVHKSSRSEKPAYPNPDLKNLHIQKRSNDLKTEKMNRRLEHPKIHI